MTNEADRRDVLIEAVCGSADDCVEADAGGADRIELCVARVVGGLTPSLGTLIEARAGTQRPIVCMIRPRGGGFCYTAGQFAAMRRDAAFALEHGADGIVFGVLREDGTIDVPRCRELVSIAADAGREAVFHRAFDLVPDPRAALDALIDLGVTRVLTSGQQPTALEGAALIAELIARAAGRIDILPGGGIRDTNAADLLRATGATQLHLGPSRAVPDPSVRANPRISFTSGQIPADDTYSLTDREALARVRAAVSR